MIFAQNVRKVTHEVCATAKKRPQIGYLALRKIYGPCGAGNETIPKKHSAEPEYFPLERA